jgi:hypothetical protein
MEAAYQKNMTELDAAEAGITPAYQAARDKTAAASEQGKRSFAEYASAKGLNSGRPVRPSWPEASPAESISAL